MIKLLKQKSHTLIIIAVLIAIAIISYITWQNTQLKSPEPGSQIQVETVDGDDSAAGEA